MNYYKKLPKSWKELKLKEYLKLVHLSPNINGDDTLDEIDLSISILSILLDEDEATLEALQMHEMIKLTSAINFFSSAPEKAKSTLNLKLHTELTYDDFVNYQKLQEKPFENMVEILKIFSKKPLTDEEILNLDMVEVFNSFRLLHQKTMKSLNSLQVCYSLKLMKLKMKEKIHKVLYREKHS